MKKAVIPAAGFGTRFLPFAKSVPKELIPLVDKPVIQYVVEEAVACGIEDILIILSAGKEAIKHHFEPALELEKRLKASGKTQLLEEMPKLNNLARISYVYQHELNGLGGALRLAEDFVAGEDFALLLGDTVTTGARPVLAELLELYERKRASVVALEELPLEEVQKYGVVKGENVSDNIYLLEDMVEKPLPSEAPSNLAVASRYIFTPAIFDALRQVGPGKNNEIQLPDGMRLVAAAEPFYGVVVKGRRHDAGEKFSFLCNTVEFALAREDLREEFLEFLKRKLDNC